MRSEYYVQGTGGFSCRCAIVPEVKFPLAHSSGEGDNLFTARVKMGMINGMGVLPLPLFRQRGTSASVAIV